MEAVAAVCYLMGGSDGVILRHPETVRLTRAFIDLMINGGMASDVQEIPKRLEAQDADLISLSPEPNLDFGEPEAAPKPKAAKPEKKEAAPKAQKKEEGSTPESEKKAQPEPVAEIEAVSKKLGINLEELFKKVGCNKDDIEHTAKKHGLTIEQTLKKLGGIK